jgi:hypothetical protein
VHLSHRCAAVVLQLTIKIISEKNHSSVVDPTTNDVDIYFKEKKKRSLTVRDLHNETFHIILCHQHWKSISRTVSDGKHAQWKFWWFMYLILCAVLPDHHKRNCNRMSVCIMSHCSMFTYSLYSLGAPNSLIPFHLKTALLWWFNVTGNRKTYLGLHVRSPIFFPILIKFLFFSTDFHQCPQNQISQKCIQWLLHWYAQTDGQTVEHYEANRRFYSNIQKRLQNGQNVHKCMQKWSTQNTWNIQIERIWLNIL